MNNKELANTVRVRVGELNRVLKEAMENDLRVYLVLEKSMTNKTQYQTIITKDIRKPPGIAWI